MAPRRPPHRTAERRRPEHPGGFERVSRPDPLRPRSPDLQGRRALYSVDPDANPTYAVIVSCPRCEVERGLSFSEARSLLRPPFVVNPFCRSIWTRCPTCERRVWLRVQRGPGIPWPL